MGQHDRHVMRLLRALPRMGVVVLLLTFVIRYGPTAGGSALGAAGLLVVIVTTTLAFGSGAWTLPRKRARDPRRLGARIDWDEFDRARQRWSDRRRR